MLSLWQCKPEKPYGARSLLSIMLLPFLALSLGNLYPLTLRREGRGEFMPVIGRRCALLASEDGRFEVWIYPFKAFWDGRISLETTGGEIPLSQVPRSVIVSPPEAVLTLKGERIKGDIEFLTSFEEKYCLIRFSLNEEVKSILVRLNNALLLMWPAPTPGRVEEIREGNALVFRREVGPGKVLQCAILSDKPFQFSQGELKIEGNKATLVFSSSPNLELSALYGRTKLDNMRRYADFFAKRVRLTSSHLLLKEAFDWAEVGLDKCFVETDIGNGFVAGYHFAGEGNRPGFAWFFGRDSSWMSFASLCVGGFEEVKENLLLQMRYQIKEGDNKGKIYHEVSLAHDYVPDPGYAYPAGDSTPLFVVTFAEYIKWSGDLDFLKKHWDNIVWGIQWCERMDVDGDLLMDNPPAGHQWFDGGEKNMIDLVAIWKKALEEGAYLADIMGRKDLKEEWLGKAKKLGEILNRDFWNEKRGYLYDRKLPDNSFLDIATCNPFIPLLWRQIDESKAQRALTLISSPQFSTPWGVRTRSREENTYNPWGYHEGTVWPLVTGWASLAEFANCHPEEGYFHLLSNAKLTRDFSLGYIPEILNGDDYIAGGCPLQGWSEAMVILPFMKGILGLEPDVPHDKVEMTLHIPNELRDARIHNIRIGDGRWAIEWETKEGERRIRIRRGKGKPLLVDLCVSLGEYEEGIIWVDGKKIAFDKRKSPCGYHLCLSAPCGEEMLIALYR